MSRTVHCVGCNLDYTVSDSAAAPTDSPTASGTKQNVGVSPQEAGVPDRVGRKCHPIRSPPTPLVVRGRREPMSASPDLSRAGVRRDW